MAPASDRTMPELEGPGESLLVIKAIPDDNYR